MSKELAERIRRQRGIKVPVGKFIFLARRPTDVEWFSLDDVQSKPAWLALNFVTGWDQVIEDDVVGGGGQDPLIFSLEAWQEWCADRQDFWVPIGRAVFEAFVEHRKSMEEAQKK
jgi:hypothetical protein